ncbi:MAG: hypothetical protein ACTSX1_10180 [Candidatus Heimdallarchaeaceae archaeon]
MGKAKLYQDLYDNKIVKDYFKDQNIDTNMKEKLHISYLGRYLRWRNITIDEFIIFLKGNGDDKELRKVSEYREFLKKNGKFDYTAQIKRFLRFNGLIIQKNQKMASVEKTLYYVDKQEDQYMVEYMELQQGLSEGSIRRINRAVYEFCLFVDKKPTEIINALENGEWDVKKIGRLIVDFKFKRENPPDELKEKFGWKEISHEFAKSKTHAINQFFELVALVKPIFRSNMLGKEDTGIDGLKRNLITKKEIKKIADAMNINQKCLLFGLYESGINATDLVKTTYNDIKHALNLEASLEDTRECVCWFNRREKTKVGHIAVIGQQTIYYLQQKLAKRKRLYSKPGAEYEFSDEELVFSQNYYPYSKPTSKGVNNAIRDKSLEVGVEKITCRDIRRTNNTLLAEDNKIPPEHRHILFGHEKRLMTSQAYTISDLVKYEEFYKRSYKNCFFLEYDDLKYRNLKDETEKTKDQVVSLEKSNRTLTKLLIQLIEANKGEPMVIDEELLDELKESI